MLTREYVDAALGEALREILTSYHAKRVLLVTGLTAYAESGAEEKIEPLLHDIGVEKFCGFSANPKLSEALEGVELCRKLNPDIIIAVGGGSSIDMAKLIAILSTNDVSPYLLVSGEAKISKAAIPLVAIPTTAGTGSEVTHFAVVYSNGTKYSLAHDYMLPSHAIIDSSLSWNMSPTLTAVTGLDALCQAIESYWSVHATVESKKLARESIKLASQSLENAVNDPDKKSRRNMTRASFLAGKAINLTKTTAPHALSYYLTSQFGIAHGHAVALTIGSFFKINTDKSLGVNDVRGRSYVEKTMKELCETLNCDSAEACNDFFSELLLSLSLEKKLSSLGVTGNHLGDIVASVNVERLKNHPVILTDIELQHVVKGIF